MIKISKHLIGITGLAIVIGSAVLPTAVMAAEKSALAEGQQLAFDRSKGNCLACHMIPEGVSPGNIAPPLIAMKARYPDKSKLYDQIYDASKKNPETAMPLFGHHEILSKSEMDKLVEYIHSL